MKTGMNRYSSASTDQTPSAQWRSRSRDLAAAVGGRRRVLGRGERRLRSTRHQIAASVRLRVPSRRAYRKMPTRMNSISVNDSAAAVG